MKLYDYQIAAIHNLRNGCILCGGVGSGKSLTALGYYYLQNGGSESYLQGGKYKDLINPKKLYIITTARKRDTHEWEGELAKYLLYSKDVVIDSWNNIQKYATVTGSFFIFDEQRVIGYGAWTKAFLKISRVNNWILLSATPGDTWSDYIPVFIANGFYRNKTEFSREHCVYSRFTKYPKIDKYVNTGRLIRLRNKILVDMDFSRQTISHHENVYCDYDILAYKSVNKTRWNPYLDLPIQNASELCYTLRRVVNSDETRQVALLEILDKHPKAIIFYNFDYELEILRNVSYLPNTAISEWNGHKHQEIPNSEKWVYLVQYTAGCEGWNCITTDTIIFYSQNYSYRVLEQACGRINRLNTPYKDLYYYHIKSHAGIDLAIAKALKAKKNFNEGKFSRWNDHESDRFASRLF